MKCDLSGFYNRESKSFPPKMPDYTHHAMTAASTLKQLTLKHCEKSLSLGGNDDNRRHRALRNMAVIKNSTGDFREALALAGQAQNVAGKIGNFHGKTDAIHEEARAWIGLGNFAQGSPCAARPGNCLSPVVFSGLWRRTLEFDREPEKDAITQRSHAILMS
jgi:hypothetical protein